MLKLRQSLHQQTRLWRKSANVAIFQKTINNNNNALCCDISVFRTLSSTTETTTPPQSDSSNILNVYQSRVQLSQLKDDPHQLDVVKQLDALNNNLRDYNPSRSSAADVAKSLLGTPLSMITKIFSQDGSPDDYDDIPPPKVSGLYLHGDVGCGKTMLMDLFYENCCVDRKHKRRVHFHSFMLEFHNRLHRYKTEHKSSDSRVDFKFNPIPDIAETISKESWLLCLDEFQVTDIGDAMILKLFFRELFARGMIMVATSNRAPDDLYRNGIQRSAFLPFIPLLKKHCDVYHIQSGIDYRRLITSSEHQVFYVKDAETNSKLDLVFKVLANNETDTIRPKTLRIKSRNVDFQKTCGRVLDSTFDELCNKALGAIDYLTISQAFHTVIVRDIPQMSVGNRVQARRFITMIDTFYDHHVRMLFSADVSLDEMFSTKKVDNHETIDSNRQLMDDLGIQLGKDSNSKAAIFTGEEEIFAFDRTLSRLSEMQTSSYWNYRRVD